MPKIHRLAIIGLDCFEPSLVFDHWRKDLPTLSKLCDSGTFGELTSCIPPITVPAWSCMASSKDPGTLGIYGFRNRKDHTYDGLSIAFSTAVKEPRLWEMLTAKGKTSLVVGVPGTWPVSKQIKGKLISCFLTPNPEDAYGNDDPAKQFTSPASFKDEIKRVVGEYLVDVKGFRTDDKDWLLKQIYEMTEKRFKLVRHMVKAEPWDLLWMVEMGTDRIHHGFWQNMDPLHHRHVPGNEFENAIHDYYVYLDGQIAGLLADLDQSKTAVMVVSDHGAKRMDGGICFNDWLIREGYLTLTNKPTGPTKFDYKNVDWSKTTAWGDGGYYGRCFINVKGREPNGIVPSEKYEAMRAELTAKLEALVDHNGQHIGTRCYRPEDIYKQSNRVPPDLVVIFGDLHWRSVGTVGNLDTAGKPTIYTFENDTGPDDANHAQQGMYILSHPSLPANGRVNGPTLYDVTPTALKLLDEAVPGDMRGTALV